jgi:rhodanese-related sulfurtransferase
MFKNNPDKEYIIFCGLGGQSTLATKTMQEMGLKNVKNMTGGIAAWKDKK